VPLGQAAGDAGLWRGQIEYGDLSKKVQQSTFGAHFVEVGVDIAIPAKSGCAACWRSARPDVSSIRSPARSQVIGAMTMGVVRALMESWRSTSGSGFFVNHDLAGYEVPVHADIPHQEVVFLDETDPMSSPMKAKGVGELGLCGVGAAIANAIYNATGVRVREYPITLDKIIGGMAKVA
jgi:xanthine dehydrogenase YagR molybdenum-binding subunit